MYIHVNHLSDISVQLVCLSQQGPVLITKPLLNHCSLKTLNVTFACET